MPLNARGGKVDSSRFTLAPSIEENKFETWTLELQRYRSPLLRTLKHSFWAWLGRRQLKISLHRI